MGDMKINVIGLVIVFIYHEVLGERFIVKNDVLSIFSYDVY